MSDPGSLKCPVGAPTCAHLSRRHLAGEADRVSYVSHAEGSRSRDESLNDPTWVPETRLELVSPCERRILSWMRRKERSGKGRNRRRRSWHQPHADPPR